MTDQSQPRRIRLNLSQIGAPSGAAQTTIDKAYDQGYQQARRERMQRQLIASVASLLAALLFDLGKRHGWW